MLFVRVMFVDSIKNNLYVYKLPEYLTTEQIDWYFTSHLSLVGEWRFVNDVKIHRRLSATKSNLLFATDKLISELDAIRSYFNQKHSRDALLVQMRVYACRYLYNKGMIMREIADVVGYKNHTSIIHNCKKYIGFCEELKYDDFMKIVRKKEYPKIVDGKLKFIKQN